MSTALIVLLVAFFGLLIICLPISFSIGTASLLAMICNGKPLQMVAQRIFVSVDSFTLLAVPFFILAGDLMIQGGISKRLIDLANALVGWVKGGMAYVTLIASAFFGAISGSALATTSAIGGLMYPEMLKKGYRPSFAAAIGAVGGTLGILIPPSIAFIIFGTQTGTSVTKLFAGGAVAGVIVCVFYMVAARLELSVSKTETHEDNRPSLKEVAKSFAGAFWGLLCPLIILGGINSGRFTATEAACVANIYALIVGFFIYRELTIKKAVKAIIGAGISTATILFLVGIASLFSWILTIEGVSAMLNRLVSSSGLSKIMFLLIVNVIYLILGMLMETVPIIILTAPIFFPVASMLGVVPIHFGIITVVNLAFGLFTPPFGTCVFMANTYSKQPVMSIVKNCRMFYVFGLLAILLITYVEPLTMWIVG